MFEVMAKRCTQCLFSDNKIVSDERKQDLIDASIRKQTYFVCHLTRRVCCRGFYDEQLTIPVRLAKALDVVDFVRPHGRRLR